MTDINLLENQPVAWTPSPEIIERAQLTKFMCQVGVATWDELYQFSIRDVEKFPKEFLNFLDIKFDPPYEKLLDTSNGIEFPNWFTRSTSPPKRGDAEKTQAETRAVASVPVDVQHAGLNITTMCLDRWQTDRKVTFNEPAIIWEGEEGDTRTVGYHDLLYSVTACAGGLRACGLKKGDAIGIHMPM